MKYNKQCTASNITTMTNKKLISKARSWHKRDKTGTTIGEGILPRQNIPDPRKIYISFRNV